MSFLYWGAPNWRQRHYRRGIMSVEESVGWSGPSAFSPRSILYSPGCCWPTLPGSAAGWRSAQQDPQAWLPTLFCHRRGYVHPRGRTRTLSSLNVMRFLQSQSSRQPCPPAYRLRPPHAPVCSGRERGIRNWLRKKNFESCYGRLLGLE